MGTQQKKPDWLKVSYNKESVDNMIKLLEGLSLNTVCKEANCPNLGECYKKRTATFMILGSQCTRGCKFCNVSKGEVELVDPHEPENIGKAVKELNLDHVVITCVTRDDLADYGARHFAKTIAEIRKVAPETTIEVLISDFGGSYHNMDIVIEACPNVINHNVETIPDLYAEVRPEANYHRSLDILRYVKEKNPNILTKTGIMVGLGEDHESVLQVMDDALANGCDIFTIGQYLQPSAEHYPMKEYVDIETFEKYKKIGQEKGFRFIASHPLVRSSYKAAEALKGAKS